MSDEPKQSPLRLKPRLRPDDEKAAPSPADEKSADNSESTQEAAAEATPKLRLKPRVKVDSASDKPAEEAPKAIRLKPRLAAEPEPAKEAATPTSDLETPSTPDSEAPADKPAVEAKPKFRLKPRLAAEGEATPVKETKGPADEPEKAAASSPVSSGDAVANPAPKFKLKKKEPEPALEESEAAPAEEEANVPPKITMDPPVSVDEAGAPAMPPAPLVQDTSADDLDEDDLLSDEEDEEALPPKKSGKKLVGLLVLIIVGAGGYFGWQYLGPATPEPPPETPAVQKGPTPSATLNKIAALPGQLINKAQEAVDARDEGGQADVEAALDQNPTPPAPAEPEVVVQQVTAHSQSMIAPDVTATTSTVMSAVEAGPAFQNFVAQARINGVFQGSPSRALINGHTYREGEMVDPSLGIYFDHVLPAEKLIVFRDDSGATVQRKY